MIYDCNEPLSANNKTSRVGSAVSSHSQLNRSEKNEDLPTEKSLFRPLR